MKPADKKLLTHVLLVLSIGVVAFLIWEIIKAISAGEKTIAGILKAPFTAVSNIWSGITNLFSSSSSGVATPQPAPILNSAGQQVGTIDPTSPLYGLFAPTDQADTQATINSLLGNAASPAEPVWNFTNYPAS
jgi:hypothetical protein